MNYPWRSAAAQNIHADSAASSSLPSDRSTTNLPIKAGTVASRISFLQKLSGNQKTKSPSKIPSRLPRSISITRREKSNKSPHRSRSPPQIRPQVNRRRENSRSSFGRRPTNIFGTPASRNSQPNEQPQTGTNHSYLGLQTLRSNHDEGHARAGYSGTPRTGGFAGPPSGHVSRRDRGDAAAGQWAPVSETTKFSNKRRDQRVGSRRVNTNQGMQRLEAESISKHPPSNAQIPKQPISAQNTHLQKEKTRRGEKSNSRTSISTSSTLRRQSVRDLFDTHGIERPSGFASSEVGLEEAFKSQKHRVCHLCMWVHDKNENICWKCGHRLCRACDGITPFLKRGKEASFAYDEVKSSSQPKPLNTDLHATTPRPSKKQIAKSSLMRPLPIPLQVTMKDTPSKRKPDSTEPFPLFDPKNSPPHKDSGVDHVVQFTHDEPLHSCPGIYVPDKPQITGLKAEDTTNAQEIYPLMKSFRQCLTNGHSLETHSSLAHHSRYESCEPTNLESFIFQHPTPSSLAHSDDVIAMDGRYTADESNNENIYRSQSNPDSKKASQPITRLYRLLNGSIHRTTELDNDSDHRDIPRTAMRVHQLPDGSTNREFQSDYESDHSDIVQPSANLHRYLTKSTYQPVQPNYASDNTEYPKPFGDSYPFPHGTTYRENPKYGSDYVECHGYPRTGHWDCNRSPVHSGILGNCQHCLDDCECSACQSTVHSVRCCTNEVHEPMIHHHHSPAKTSLEASYGSSNGQHSLERKPYILSSSQTYDRSTLHECDNVSEWLESPDEPPPLTIHTPKNTPADKDYQSNNIPSVLKKTSDIPPTIQSQSPWTSSSRPIVTKSAGPLLKKTLSKVSSGNILRVDADPGRSSPTDGTKDQPILSRYSGRLSTQESSGYPSTNPWRERESINFPRSSTDGKEMSRFSLQQISRRSTDCETSDICGQSEWAATEKMRRDSPSISRQRSEKKYRREQVRKKIHQWEDRRSESRRGGMVVGDTSEVPTPIGGYFDAKMRWCASGSTQDRGARGMGMGLIAEEEGEGENIEVGIGDENRDEAWRSRVEDTDMRERDRELKDERAGEDEGRSGVKGVTIVVHMNGGEDLVLRMTGGGNFGWERLERLVEMGKR